MRVIYFIVLILFSLPTFGQVDITIEAENATLTGTYEEKLNTNASGGKFIQLKNPATLTFEVNGVSEAGTYKLDVYNFNGGTTQDINLTVNGVSSTVTLQPSNWAYQGTAQLTSLNVDLNAGDNTIALSYLNVGVSLDYFQILDANTPSAAAYYISASGNDTNDGTSEGTPWKTIDKLNEALATDASGGWVAPGTKILFKRGDAFYGHLMVNRSGTLDNLIELSCYGNANDELPILSGSGGTITGGDYFEAVTMTNSSHVLVTKLWIKNDRTDGSRYTWGEYTSYGIKIVATKWGGILSNVTFRDVKVSDVFGITIPPPSEFNSLKATGIRMESDENEEGTEVSIKDILVEDSYFTNIGKAGVWCTHKGDLDAEDGSVNRNQNIVVRNNTFYRTGGSGVIMSKTYNGLIEHNDFDQTGYSNGVENRLAGRGSGAWVFSCQNIIAQYNRSYGIRGPGDSYGMHIDFGNKNILFQYNYSEDSEGGFCEILGDNYNCTYRFNVSMNDGFRDFHGYTLWVSGYAGSGKDPIRSDKNYIYNNTIYLNSSIYTPRISIFALNTYVYNNIFVASNGAKIGYNSAAQGAGVSVDVGSGEFVMDYNLFEGDIHNNFKNLGSNSKSGSPLFVNEGGNIKENYKIQPGSPVIDMGKTFTEPSFPMAGSGIFKDVSTKALTDAFGITVDIQHAVPNIGASNAFNSDNPLGIGDYEKVESFFSIFPNPVTEAINLKFSREIELASVEIYDVRARLIHTVSILNTQNNSKVDLPNSIKNGIYFLRIIDGNNSQTAQFILYR